MGRLRRQAAVEAGFAVFLLALCTLVAVGARDIPPAIYDPVGSAALPLALAALIAAGAALMLLRSARQLMAGPTGRDNDDEGSAGGSLDRGWLAAAFTALLVGYVATMSADLLGFREATLLFLLASGVMLARGARRLLLPVAAVAATIAIGGSYLFTRFFFIALP